MEIWEKLKSWKFLNFSIIISLVVLNVIIKSIHLSDYNIDVDEPFSLFHSQKPLIELFKIFIWENNPPLFFVILHFWIKMFGIGVVSARFLPMLFSALAVIFIYKIGRKFLTQKIAIGASLLYTFSNLNIMEAHDTRVYSLLVLLTTASMYFYFSLIGSENKRKYSIALTITNMLLIYAHFLAFFIIILQAIYTLLIPAVRKKIFKKHLYSSILLFISYLPYLYLLIERFIRTVQAGAHSKIQLINPYNSFLNTFGNNFLTGNNFLLILLIFVLYILINRSKLTIYETMILGWCLFLFMVIFFVSFKIQIITIPKYLIFLTPGFFLTLMIAANYLSGGAKIFNVSLLTFCVFLMVISSDFNASMRYQSKETVSYIQKHKSDSTLVFISPPWIDIVFTYHYSIDAFKDYSHYMKYLNDDNIFVLSTATEINQQKLANASDAYLIDGWNCMSITDPNNSILSVLSQRFGGIGTSVFFNGYMVYHFENRKSDRDSIP